METYSKILTLYKRDEKYKCTDELSIPEFGLVDQYYVAEKIDGQNIRIVYNGLTTNIQYLTRESDDPANVPGDLRKLLEQRFPYDKVHAELGPVQAVVFGEGYGAGIQKGGDYSPTKDFIVFDVKIEDWWLEPEAAKYDGIKSFAAKFDCDYVPEMGVMTKAEITDLCKQGFDSILALKKTGAKRPAEGIIARTVPGLKTRDNHRLIFKLKLKDYSR